jgi:hypothetical protein
MVKFFTDRDIGAGDKSDSLERNRPKLDTPAQTFLDRSRFGVT